ncbi:hypothetical protein FXO37_29687 [Capsicum annuum]|nr:hypothetical protein FXO37_29687 [Capsicum annuum]
MLLMEHVGIIGPILFLLTLISIDWMLEHSEIFIQDIHPSHYGRICPIDTSEGINVGLIGSLAIHARIGHWGSLEIPFYEISERSAGVRMLYLSPGRDEYYMVPARNSLALNQDIQEEQIVPARYRQEFLTIAWE